MPKYVCKSPMLWAGEPIQVGGTIEATEAEAKGLVDSGDLELATDAEPTKPTAKAAPAKPTGKPAPAKPTPESPNATEGQQSSSNEGSVS